MKNSFWAGVGSAVIGGLILLFAEQQYSDWKAANAKSIALRVNDDVAALTKEDVSEIQKALEDWSSVRIASITARNDGSKLLTDATVHFSTEISTSSELFSYGVVPEAGADDETVFIEPKKSGFDVTFRSLERGDSQTFWIAYRCCEIFSASPRTPDLAISQSVSDYDDSSTAWRWFERAIILVISFFAGAAFESAITSKMLKNRGFNLTALIKKPKLSDTDKEPSDG